MHKSILLAVAFFIIGCDNKQRPLSTAQIAQKIQECRDYNLSVQWAYDGFTGQIHHISCIPSKDK